MGSVRGERANFTRLVLGKLYGQENIGVYRFERVRLGRNAERQCADTLLKADIKTSALDYACMNGDSEVESARQMCSVGLTEDDLREHDKRRFLVWMLPAAEERHR